MVCVVHRLHCIFKKKLIIKFLSTDSRLFIFTALSCIIMSLSSPKKVLSPSPLGEP